MDYIVNVELVEDVLILEFLFVVGFVRIVNNFIGDFFSSELNFGFFNNSLGYSYFFKVVEFLNSLREIIGKKKWKRERGEWKYGKKDERKVEIGVEVKNGGEENECRDWNLFKILYDIFKFIVLVKKNCDMYKLKLIVSYFNVNRIFLGWLNYFVNF